MTRILHGAEVLGQLEVFLSHNSLDKPAVEAIQGLLDRGERPIPCWLDKDDLRSQGTWVQQLEAAISKCGAAAIFYGPDGRGPVHQSEIDLLLKRAMYEPDSFRIVPVLLPGADPSAVQGFASLHMWADFRQGLDDQAAMQRLRAFILGEAPTTGPNDDPKVPKPEIEPYRGLERFEARHQGFFFGRDAEILELCCCLDKWPFTAVIGGSGSGKSSVVRAGLQTRLAHEARRVLNQTTTITVLPGTNPIRQLADQVVASLPKQSVDSPEQLADDFEARFRASTDGLINILRSRFPGDDQHILLVIDQFEELFTHSADRPVDEPSKDRAAPRDTQATQFVELLAEVAASQLDRFRIVITLRADFFDRCLRLPTLKGLIENRTLLLGELSHEALREVIESPALKVQVYFEKGLVARILQDVKNQHGSLPLLQHALKELWEERCFGWLTDDGYEKTGGVEGALKKRADATLAEMDKSQQEIAKNIFLRLTTLGEGVSDTRRRVHSEELYPDNVDRAAIDVVLIKLSSQSNRLIVTNDDGTAEVTHEALIQRWDRLRAWLADNRDDKRQHDRLRDAANEWIATSPDSIHHRDDSYLWEGVRLDLANKLQQAHPHLLSANERDFLDASLRKREFESAEYELRRRNELKLAHEREFEAQARAEDARHAAAKQRRLAHWALVTAGISIGMLAVAVWEWSVANREKVLATNSNAKANGINSFLIDDLLAVARPDQLGKDVTLRTALDTAAQRVDKAFAGQPETEAAVRLAIGDTYKELGLFQEAEPFIRRAVEIRRERLGTRHPDFLSAIDSLATLLHRQGKWTDAEAMFRENLETRRRELGTDHPDTLASIEGLAWSLQALGKDAESEALCREALERYRLRDRLETRGALVVYDDLGQILQSRGKMPEAELIFRKNLDTRTRLLGPEHPDTLISMNNLGLFLQEKGDLEEAENLFRTSSRISSRIRGKSHLETLLTNSNLVTLLTLRGRFDEAETLGRETLDAQIQALGSDHPDTLGSRNRLAMTLQALGKLDDAEAHYRLILDSRRRTQGARHPATLSSMNNLASLLHERQKLAETEALIREAFSIQKSTQGADHPATLLSMRNISILLQKQGKFADATEICRECLEIRTRVLGAENPQTLFSMNDLAAMLDDQEKLVDAEKLFRNVLALRRKVLPAGHADIATTLSGLGKVLTKAGQPSAAEPYLREAIENQRKSLPEGDWYTAQTESLLGACLAAQTRFDEAEPLVLHGYEALKQNPSAWPSRVHEALERIVLLYEDWKKPDKVDEWKALRDVAP